MSGLKPAFLPVWFEERDACGVGFVHKPQESHAVIADALAALSCMEHRGACGADRQTGDGAGILTSIPWALLADEGWPIEAIAAVGTVYLPRGQEEECRLQTNKLFEEEGLKIAGWRKVPTRPEVLGELAFATCPQIEHVLIERDSASDTELDVDRMERKLMIARKLLINLVRARSERQDFYIASLSTKTIVYKGLVKAPVLSRFYPDLENEKFAASFAVFHRRFSTNTFPRWSLAQPFRMLGHNGEINTLVGNRNWMRAREPVLDHPAWVGREHEQQPVVYLSGSDSGNLDNALEMLIRAGHSPESALMQLMPEAYKHQSELAEYPEIVDFYEYYSALQEPWDGPALIVYSDGKTVGAILDRNGLRPARYSIQEDGSLIVSSEAGVLDLPDSSIVEKGRLGPGQMIVVDLQSKQVIKNWQVKKQIAGRLPYGEWLKRERQTLACGPFSKEPEFSHEYLTRLHTAFGYGKEEVDMVVAGMAATGDEPVFSMGDDTPLPVLSQKPRVLFDYFKQRFAQVTNPPIDPLREKLVMSLETHLGRRSNLLHPASHAARTLHLTSPIINESELQALESLGHDFAAQKLYLHTGTRVTDLNVQLHRLCVKALDAVKGGKTIIILSDRKVGKNISAIPVLLAVGAVHHQLIRAGLRLKCSIVVETAQAWSIHHFACLTGYGAQAICPYLAFETVRHWFASDKVRALVQEANEAAVLPAGKAAKLAPYVGLTVEKAQLNYKKAVENGLLKVLSKMGISVLMSYIGAQIFECIGLGPAVIRRCFDGTTSRIGGMEIDDISREMLRFHAAAFADDSILTNYGIMNYRTGGEFHGNNPEVVRALHAALGVSKKAADDNERLEQFAQYSRLIAEREPAALRDLIEFRSDRPPIELSQVEPAAEIVKRFCTGGMSLGSLSKETHETVAVAMNRLGGKSNSGEGGEDPKRYYPIAEVSPDGTSSQFPGLKDLRPGDKASSAIRQVASARFGVTPEYLVTSRQLEIKIAQGAKPGEGGQLPGHKVSPYIASLRRAKPGTPLISPPPHHDIYSIEDLAQLIYDLKEVNPRAKVSVKLVSQIGVGTVAAGVAKANADIVQISGHDGGTGASPIGSIKHAGAPWELGLAETHQVLMANSLRERVLLRVDGGLKSGWEVVMAAMLGADEYGFGSIALIASGCIMARICHTNNCPIGITSQKEELRKRFPGTPEPVVEFFLFIAEEVRQTLATLGYRSIEEVLGRVDLLKQKQGAQVAKTDDLNLDCLLDPPDQCLGGWRLPAAEPHGNDLSLDAVLLAEHPELKTAIERQERFSRALSIKSTDRAVGARISGEIVKLWGDHGFNGSIDLEFSGSAGQSFAAFNVQNLNLRLVGEANDYVGKGMNGGEVVVQPSPDAKIKSWENVIVGNTCLYGATGGALFVAGQAGERFAVRNSGARAVVEGAGDHCCEYMTGGAVVVLGVCGRNFGAGMTGGIAYVLDADRRFAEKFNGDEGKRLQPVSPMGRGAKILKGMIEEHFQKTGSLRAQEILANWDVYLAQFLQVVPPGEVESDEAVAAPVESNVLSQENALG